MREGEVFGLLGPNGAGKTSIISILTGVEKPTGGKALVFGTDVASGDRYYKAKLGCVPQEIVSHGFFTVEEILQIYSGYFGIKNNKEQINYLLERLMLADHRDKVVRQLSGGMKRRLLNADDWKRHQFLCRGQTGIAEGGYDGRVAAGLVGRQTIQHGVGRDCRFITGLDILRAELRSRGY